MAGSVTTGLVDFVVVFCFISFHIHFSLFSCLPTLCSFPASLFTSSIMSSSLFSVFHFLHLSFHLDSTRADQRNLEKSTPSISRAVTGDQPLHLSNPRITRGTHRDRLLMQTSMFEPLSCTRNKAMLLLPLKPFSIH